MGAVATGEGVDWASEALGTTTLGDVRRRERVLGVLRALAAHPGASLSMALGGEWAATQGAYRLLDNPHLDPAALSASIGAASAARAAVTDVVLLIEDSTEIQPTSPVRCRDLGCLGSAQRHGLWLHTTLGVSADGVPLGLLDQRVWTRDPDAAPRRAARYTTPIEGKESRKWLDGVIAAQARLAPGQPHIVVADREADIYELYAVLAQTGGDFVVRAAQDRALATGGRLSAAVSSAPVVGHTTITVRRTPQRAPREARVEVRATTVTLSPPQYDSYQAARRRWWAAHPEVEPLLEGPLLPLTVGVVEVCEVEDGTRPDGEEPLHWRLLSSLPVGDWAAAAWVVQCYRWRWLVERFHYVLKQGVAIERLQLEQPPRWERATVLYSLVAWRVLWLTELARVTPDASADLVVEPAAWQALAIRMTGTRPTAPPDLATFVGWVGKLGGHLGRRSDGPPGVKAIWRGLQRLSELTALWHILHTDTDLAVL